MENVLGTLFSDIANAIREKNGETGTMKPAEFPEKISDLPVSTGSLQYGSGYLKATASEMTIEHGMGEVPDVILFVMNAAPTGNTALVYALGYSGAMMVALGGGYLSVASSVTVSMSVKHGIETTSSNAEQYGCIRDATETTFTIGGSLLVLQEGTYYSRYAIAGIL